MMKAEFANIHINYISLYMMSTICRVCIFQQCHMMSCMKLQPLQQLENFTVRNNKFVFTDNTIIYCALLECKNGHPYAVTEVSTIVNLL